MTEARVLDYVGANIPVLKQYGADSPISYDVDGLIVFGRGIERLPGKNLWHPTSLIEKGKGDRYHHTGLRVLQGEIGDVVGGGNANVWATRVYLESYFSRNGEFPYLVFAAGRPSYYLKVDDPSEGEVMRNKLLQIMPKCLPLDTLKIGTLPDNQDTRDDALNSLQLMCKEGAKKVAIITIGPHIERSYFVVKSNIFKDIQLGENFSSISFIDSFRLLTSRSNRHEGLIIKLSQRNEYLKTTDLEKKWTHFIQHYDY